MHREFPGWQELHRGTHSSQSPRKILQLTGYLIHLLTWSRTKWFWRQSLKDSSSPHPVCSWPGGGGANPPNLQSSSVIWSSKPQSSVQSSTSKCLTENRLNQKQNKGGDLVYTCDNITMWYQCNTKRFWNCKVLVPFLCPQFLSQPNTKNLKNTINPRVTVDFELGLILWLGTRVVISAGRNNNFCPGGRNWQKLAETGLNRQKLAEIKNLKLMHGIERDMGSVLVVRCILVNVGLDSQLQLTINTKLSTGDRKKNHQNKETVLPSLDFENELGECFVYYSLRDSLYEYSWQLFTFLHHFMPIKHVFLAKTSPFLNLPFRANF